MSGRPIRLLDSSLDAEFAVGATDGTLGNFLFDDPLTNLRRRPRERERRPHRGHLGRQRRARSTHGRALRYGECASPSGRERQPTVGSVSAAAPIPGNDRRISCHPAVIAISSNASSLARHRGTNQMSATAPMVPARMKNPMVTRRPSLRCVARYQTSGTKVWYVSGGRS